MNFRTWGGRMLDGFLWTSAAVLAFVVSSAIADHHREEEARQAKMLESVHQAGVVVGGELCEEARP